MNEVTAKSLQMFLSELKFFADSVGDSSLMPPIALNSICSSSVHAILSKFSLTSPSDILDILQLTLDKLAENSTLVSLLLLHSVVALRKNTTISLVSQENLLQQMNVLHMIASNSKTKNLNDAIILREASSHSLSSLAIGNKLIRDTMLNDFIQTLKTSSGNIQISVICFVCSDLIHQEDTKFDLGSLLLAVCSSLTSPKTTQSDKRLLSRTLLCEILSKTHDPETLMTVWNSLKAHQVDALLAICPTAKWFLPISKNEFDLRNDNSFFELLRKTLLDAKEGNSETFSKSCALFLLSRASEGLPNQKDWNSFQIAFEAFETHTISLIKPAYIRLLTLANQSNQQKENGFKLPDDWLILLFQKALTHFHAPARRLITTSFISNGINGIGVLSKNESFIENVVMSSFCEPLLFKGDLRHYSQKLVENSLLSYMKVKDPSKVLSWFLKAISLNSSYSSNLLVHSKCIHSLSQNNSIKFDCCNVELLSALLSFGKSCSQCQISQIKKTTCSLFVLSLPNLLSSSSNLSLFFIRELLELIPTEFLINNCKEFTSLQKIISNSWLSTNLQALVSAFMNEQITSIDSQILSKIRYQSQEISKLFVFISEDPSSTSLLLSILEPIKLVCSHIYSRPYAGICVAERAFSLLGNILETTCYSKTNYKLTPTMNSIFSNLFSILSDECLAYISSKFTEKTCGWYERMLCFSDWLCGAALFPPFHNKLQSFLSQNLKLSDASVTKRLGSLIFLHSISVRGKMFLILTQELCNTMLLSCCPSLELCLEKHEISLLEGKPWSDRLAFMSTISWEVLEFSAINGMFPSQIDWNYLLQVAKLPPSVKGLSKMLSTIRLWITNSNSLKVQERQLEDILNVSFSMFSEFSFDRSLICNWIQLAFLEKNLNRNPNLQPSISKWISKIITLGERNAFAVNFMTEVLVNGWTKDQISAEKYYKQEIISLLAFGPSRFQEDSTASISSVFDEDSEIEAGKDIDIDLEVIERSKESRDHYTRVLIAMFLQRCSQSFANNIACECSRIISHNSNIGSKTTMYSKEHRQQIHLLEIICALSPRLTKQSAEEISKELIKLSVEGDIHSSSRLLCVHALSRIGLANPSFISELCDILLKPQQKTQAIQVGLTVWSNVLMNCPNAQLAEQLVLKLLPLIIPNISGPLLVRAIAQCSLSSLLTKKKRIPSSFESVVKGISTLLFSLEDISKVMNVVYPWLKIGEFLQCSVLDVFHSLPLLLDGLPKSEVIPIALANDLLRRFELMKSDLNEDGMDLISTSTSLIPIEEEGKYREKEQQLEIWGVRKEGESTEEFGAGEVQRKPLPWIVGDEEEITRNLRRKRQDLIVVASLVDKPQNLGGMSRSADIFNISCLVVSDLRVKEHPQFQSVSVSSERWVPMKQVSEQELPNYIEQQRKEGYTIFGIEQTSESISLQEIEFPKRAVLVLGKEQTGIPANLISLMDACIEVPQLGFIRSLNVHVTSALALWEYSKQHAFKHK